MRMTLNAVVVWALAAVAPLGSAATLCVNPAATSGCSKTIGAAVAAANAGDVINVAPGTYAESVTIGKSLTLSGAGASSTIIDATGLPNGIYVDGIDNSNLAGVWISGFTVRNANFEGILVANASQVTISSNTVTGNNAGIVNSAMGPTCPNIPAFETSEGFDCGEGIHLMGAWNSNVASNTVENNAGGILISDDTGAAHDNVISSNTVSNNPADCGITIASHVPATLTNSKTALGVYHNTVTGNTSSQNGVMGEGAGVGIFASAPGTAAYENIVLNNVLTGNGIPGVAIHGHTPQQNLNGNVIIGNQISGNGADTADTATPGPTGINVASVSPVTGTIISQNTISQETYGVVVKAPGSATVQRNAFAGQFGLANLGGGAVNADSNYWGCNTNPSFPIASIAGCSLAIGSVSLSTWLSAPPK